MNTTTPIALTIEQTATELGLSEKSIRNLLRDPADPIPHFRHGSRVVIPHRELVEWAGQRTKKGTP